MIDDRGKHRVVIIDRQDFWRELSAQSLMARGFSVTTLDSYNDWPLVDKEYARSDLVILGCPYIGPEEDKLITRLFADKQNLVILCTLYEKLSPQVVRSLFVSGANDITDKSYDPAHVVQVVEQALTSLAQRDSYRRVEEDGV